MASAQWLAMIGMVAWCCMVAAEGWVHEYTFVIEPKKVTRLCKQHTIVTVNGQLPGPTLYVHEGDTLVIRAVNRAKYNATLHWHGIRQLRTAWADGPAYVTQCPIRPGQSYTYRFTIIKQEGTLWWHAHVSWLRASVYGALVIFPRAGAAGYPFPRPHGEVPIMIGEWWNRDPISVVNQALRTGAAPNVSDAWTINGQPGDLYACSAKSTFRVPVQKGQTYLFRIINAALNNQHFFKIANHQFTVVAVDANYVKPFTSNVLAIGPGQTADVLLNADQAAGRYYMAARAYTNQQSGTFDNTTTTAIIDYFGGLSASRPSMPSMPAFNDNNTFESFNRALRSLNSHEHPVDVPKRPNVKVVTTVGLGLKPCPRGVPSAFCQGPNNTRIAASMNNISFALPSTALLQAAFFGINGVFSPNFPPRPPIPFDFTGNVPRSLWAPVRGTRVMVVEFGSTVEIVFQGTSIFIPDSHPMHIHGYSFYVVGAGKGNFNPATDPQSFNLVDPVKRNTVSSPVNGWVAVRFLADNPGMWFVHCHLDDHLTWGLANAILVKNGHGDLATLPPPPPDLPKC